MERGTVDDPRPEDQASVGVTAADAVLWARALKAPPITEGLVRQWANRGKVRRVGADGRRTLYSLEDVQAMLERRKLIDALTSCNTPCS